MMIIIMKY